MRTACENLNYFLTSCIVAVVNEGKYDSDIAEDKSDVYVIPKISACRARI